MPRPEGKWETLQQIEGGGADISGQLRYLPTPPPSDVRTTKTAVLVTKTGKVGRGGAEDVVVDGSRRSCTWERAEGRGWRDDDDDDDDGGGGRGEGDAVDAVDDGWSSADDDG
eukprot:178867-Rhodomonas_salina.1